MSSMSIQVSKIDIPLANGLNAKLDVYIITLFDLDGYLSWCACQIWYNRKTLSFLNGNTHQAHKGTMFVEKRREIDQITETTMFVDLLFVTSLLLN